jgi:RHS repeat-associated protein
LERHDFEPFGHELMGTEGGWRSSVPGYGVTPTSVRQQFTGQERDDTGLDFFQARYFTSTQGRFASVDPGNAGASLFDPQSWNGYAYVSNSPLRFTDPSGLGFWDDLGGFLGSVISNIMGGWLFGGFGGGGGIGGGIVGGIAGRVNSSQPWNEQLPSGTFGGALNTGTVFGSGDSGPFIDNILQPVGGSATDIGNYNAALAYLMNDPGMALIIKQLQQSKTVYRVAFQWHGAGGNNYDPNTHTIHWDPTSSVKTIPAGKCRTPALSLGHELAHADYSPFWAQVGLLTPSWDYDNQEEKRVITGPEANAARTLGEPLRFNHQGNFVGAPNSTTPGCRK